MLSWKLKFDGGLYDDNDIASLYLTDKLYNEDWDSNTIAGNWDFIDHTIKIDGNPLKLAIDGTGTSISDHQIVFGSKNAETIDGSGDTDHLYGMAGNDTLDGQDGNDYLEGNAGQDTLHGEAGNDSSWVALEKTSSTAAPVTTNSKAAQGSMSTNSTIPTAPI